MLSITNFSLKVCNFTLPCQDYGLIVFVISQLACHDYSLCFIALYVISFIPCSNKHSHLIEEENETERLSNLLKCPQSGHVVKLRFDPKKTDSRVAALDPHATEPPQCISITGRKTHRKRRFCNNKLSLSADQWREVNAKC